MENQFTTTLLLLLALFRIVLEFLPFSWQRLPLSQMLGPNAQSIHRMGFYLSLGYFILFLPEFVFNLLH